MSLLVFYKWPCWYLFLYTFSRVPLLNFILFLSRQYETVVPLEDSVVTEVTATLQEWAVLWKQLYVVRTVLFSLHSIFKYLEREICCMLPSPLGKKHEIQIFSFCFCLVGGVANCRSIGNVRFTWTTLETSAVVKFCLQIWNLPCLNCVLK